MPPTSHVSVFALAVKRPVGILMITIASMVFGLSTYQKLSVDLMPDISYPSLTVRTEYPGSAPEEVEENITRPIEEALGVAAGLTRLSSISRAGLSDVTLEFSWDTSMSQAWQEISERLDGVFLPEEAGKPLILRYDPSLDPVLILALASKREQDQGPAGLKRLRTHAEQEIKRSLERVAGVAAIRVLGGLEEQVSVDLDEEALRRTGLSIQQVIDRLAAENVNIAGGNLEEGDTRYIVRTLNEFLSLDEMSELVLASVNGRDIKLRDLGVVRSGWADREVITRLNGAEAVEIQIQKEADANIVQMAKAVREAVFGAEGASHSIASSLPEDWDLVIASDRSVFIDSSVREVRNTAVLGGLLAILVIYLFLRKLPATFVISVAIPLSVAVTFAPMGLAGISLNIMSLGGLALGIGMLVDSGIVVVESISRRREQGDGLRDAVVNGTSEVGTAVVASTLTTVAVFLPMVFVEGVAGQVFGDLALTVVFAMLASLLVSLFVIPALFAAVSNAESATDTSPKSSWLLRIRQAVAYRTLGDLPTGALSRLSFAIPLLLVVIYVLSRVGFGSAKVAMLLPAAIGSVCLIGQSVVRIRQADGGLRVVGHLLRLLLVDPVLLIMESMWLALMWCLIVGGGAVVLAAMVVLRILYFLLAPLRFLSSRILTWLEKGYPAFIALALKQRSIVLVLTVLGFVVMAMGLSRLESSLIPEVHQGEFDYVLQLPVGTPIEKTLAVVSPLESAARQDERVRDVLLRVGADPDADSGPEEGEHTAHLNVHIAPDPPLASFSGLVAKVASGITAAHRGGLVAVREEEVIDSLRRNLETIPELEGKIARPVILSFKTPIEVEIQGYDLGLLQRLGRRVQTLLGELPSLTDVESSARPGSPEVQISYDREALLRQGLDIRRVAELVRSKVQGSAASEFRRQARRIDIVVRLQEADRSSIRNLGNLVVNPGSRTPIPLSAVADITISSGPADIRRVGQRRVAVIRANVRGGALGRASREIEAALETIDWPDGTSWRLAGQAKEMERSGRSLWIALGLSIFLVYVVMASQFESLIHPLLIMVTVPLALVGVVGILLWMSIPLSVVVFLGMIMLAGIVVNNAIVFIDYVNTLRRRGQALESALIEAGSARLRPILMTTATTVLGLLPMALGLGDGAEIRTPMALTVIAGLVTSTVLTLIVLPTLYHLVEKGRSALMSERPTEDATP